jgi:hypothetical protein
MRALDSSWFANRIGRQPMSFGEVLAGLKGKEPDPGPWKILRIRDEGYTPKVDIRDASGATYVLKFDLPEKPERNSASERICTLVMRAAGYNVPYNTIVYFRPRDLELDKDSYYRDALKKRRPMTQADLESLLARLKPRPDGTYRGMASLMLSGTTLGPYRIGHEYIYDGGATSHSLVTLGFYRRPWEVEGRIAYPEVGYYEAALFEPAKWKPNYPNLAFLRMDDSDAYWGTKIVTAYSNQVIRSLAEAGDYSRAEVTEYLEDVLLSRRDAIGNYWFDRITALEDFTLARSGSGMELCFRDLALERAYADGGSRSYRVQTMDADGRELAPVTVTRTRHRVVGLPSSKMQGQGSALEDRYGRKPSVRLLIQSNRRDGGWALPVEVVLGYSGGSSTIEILGWYHAPN